jgi:hypothetical protein
MIAITIVALVITAIYSSWTAILRASKVGLEAAASVQRSRIVLRVLEDSLSSAQSFAMNQQHYSFVAENGDEASLTFVARLAKSFPRGGKFGDLDVRRVMFAVEPAKDGTRQLVLRQTPLIMEFDEDEREHPIVLAKNVREFSMQFWDNRMRDWTDEWKQTNQIPRLILFNLKLADNAFSAQAEEEISRIISIPSQTVLPNWQMPRLPGVPGAPGQPAIPGTPGAAPGVIPGTPGVQPGVPGKPPAGSR